MPGFYTHILLGGLIFALVLTIFQQEFKAKFLYLGMISGLIPDIDIILGGFHGINIDTTIFVFPLDFLTQITAKFNLSDYLDHGIIDIEHRGITHSLEFFIIGFVILAIGLLCGVGLKKLEISSMIIISSIITLPWLSHLIADFRFVTLQGNGFEIVMSFVLWVKYRERVGLWFE
ncbi:MAG: metal-dependent hydrolase [Candidatus Hodarchaeales archaeon]|jgi:hypothetical protein